jgi:putative tryptophan/tyrosine transport system substrate-binding protein
MRRREVIAGLAGAAVASPRSASAQQGERVRRIGVLMNVASDDPEAQARIAAFRQELQQLGWTDGRDLRIDYRWAGDASRFHGYAEELLALAPDVILASATPSVQALRQVSRTVPIVFANVGDPVAMGFVDSLARPGGNTTGFTPYEFGFAAKWLELLKEIAPRVTRVAVLRDLTIGPAHFTAIQAVAPSFGVELSTVGVHDVGEIERTVATFARSSNAGLIVTPSTSALIHRDLITMLAARHRLPAVYGFRYFVTAGGLISYAPSTIDMYRRAAGYVDRILKGQKPADLPVQAPTKYELVVNLKTARALDLTIPPSLLARADEVIE